MIVFSAFDGISCLMVALKKAGIKVDAYFASEINKSAIAVSEDNHKNITRVGDITKIHYKNGILYTENRVFKVGKIDLFAGGSPCQSFSMAAAITGNQACLDGKSKLFYEYLRLLREIQAENPHVKFLLENVRMKNESKAQLDEYLGVEGVYLNSELTSYQRRPRFYWSNWDISSPRDQKINFQDFKESGDLSEYKVKRTPSREKMWNNGEDRTNSLRACANITNSKKIYCLTTKQDRCPNSGLIEYEDFCRYLTRSEMEQAQNLPVGYTNSISYNQAQAVLGNCWDVGMITHIFEEMKKIFQIQERLFA